jgi:hypothetical protein
MHPVGRRPLEEHYPLELLRCADCTLVQLSVIVDPEVVFAPDFPYSSGNSAAAAPNFEDRHRGQVHRRIPRRLVVDIGANDGTLLSKFACRTVGVEPTAQADRITGYSYRAFFSEELAQTILESTARRRSSPPATSSRTSMTSRRDARHQPAARRRRGPDRREPRPAPRSSRPVGHGLPRASALLLAAQLQPLLARTAWVSWQHTKTHGGSFRMFASKRPDTFRSRPDTTTTSTGLRGRAEGPRRDPQGAPTGSGGSGRPRAAPRSSTTAASTWRRRGVRLRGPAVGQDRPLHPRHPIPVVDEEILFGPNAPPRLLLSWHMEDIIVPKLRARGYDKPILVPLPEPHYV